MLFILEYILLMFLNKTTWNDKSLHMHIEHLCHKYNHMRLSKNSEKINNIISYSVFV